MKWWIAFGAMCLVTLTTIWVCNQVGVGHFWPFPVIIGLIMITWTVLGVAAYRTGRRNYEDGC